MSASSQPKWINPHRVFHGIWLPQWLKERPEVSVTAKLLYAELCRFAGQNGEAWPSYNLLAKNLCVSRRHAMRLLLELTEHGLITVMHIRDEVRGNRTNIYRFLWHPWMQHKEDENFALIAQENEPLVGGRDKTSQLPLVTGMSPANSTTPLVTRMSPKENHKKRVIKKYPKGASGSSAPLQATTPKLDRHRLTATFEDRSTEFSSPPPTPRFSRDHSEQASAVSSIDRHAEDELVFLPPVQRQANTALVRKGWAIARRLVGEFWENCKVKPDLRILYGYASRSMKSGFREADIVFAFERALHQCHGHAADVGELWEVSSTVHRAEILLKRCKERWEPLTIDERVEPWRKFGRKGPSATPFESAPAILNSMSIPSEEWPTPMQVRATFNACRRAAGLPTRPDVRD